MRVEKDFEDLLELFNKYHVKYCIVGAFAVGFYSKPRYSKDMDILVEPSLENGKKIVEAFKEFGFGSLKVNAQDFDREGAIIQLGFEPVRIDIITSIVGCKFPDVLNNSKIGKYGRLDVNYIGLDDLITNKKISNRKQDQADSEILLKTREKISKNTDTN